MSRGVRVASVRGYLLIDFLVAAGIVTVVLLPALVHLAHLLARRDESIGRSILRREVGATLKQLELCVGYDGEHRLMHLDEWVGSRGAVPGPWQELGHDGRWRCQWLVQSGSSQQPAGRLSAAVEWILVEAQRGELEQQRIIGFRARRTEGAHGGGDLHRGDP